MLKTSDRHIFYLIIIHFIITYAHGLHRSHHKKIINKFYFNKYIWEMVGSLACRSHNIYHYIRIEGKRHDKNDGVAQRSCASLVFHSYIIVLFEIVKG